MSSNHDRLDEFVDVKHAYLSDLALKIFFLWQFFENLYSSAVFTSSAVS